MQSHVIIPVGDEFVTAELFKPQGEIVAAMLICHGWTSSNKKYLPFAEKISQKGILTLAINLRGHGDSTYPLEKYSRRDHLTDVLTSLYFLSASQSGVPMILFGKSYGGYLSAIASSHFSVDFLILSQPALYPDSDFDSANSELIRRNPDIFRSSQEVVRGNKALMSISQFTNPLLIIESEHDEEVLGVPKLYISASEKNINRESIIIKDTDHPLTRPEWKEDYFAQISSWLESKNLLEQPKSL